MFGLPEFDGDVEGRHREHAAALHPRSRRGSRHLTGGAPILLAIETAGSACSAAVARGGAVLAAEARPLRHGHAEILLPIIERVMDRAGLAPTQLDAIAVAIGPGGFTGIRVGLAAAHGIALALGARLIGISSFAAVAARIGSSAGSALLVALDSRRADLYVQLFAADGASALAAPQSICADGLGEYVASHAGTAPLLLAGDAAEVAAVALGSRANCTIAENSAPDAVGVVAAALRELRSAAPAVPVRPLYLRPPDVTVPKPAPAVSHRVTPLPPGAAVPLAALHRACFPEDPWDAAALAPILALAGGFGYLAWESDSPTGFVLARDLGGEIEILSLGVLPRWRRRGIGAALLAAVAGEAEHRGSGSIVLEVGADNRPARRLYTAAGFVHVGRRPRYYRRLGGREDALILRRSVAGKPSGA